MGHKGACEEGKRCRRGDRGLKGKEGGRMREKRVARKRA